MDVKSFSMTSKAIATSSQLEDQRRRHGAAHSCGAAAAPTSRPCVTSGFWTTSQFDLLKYLFRPLSEGLRRPERRSSSGACLCAPTLGTSYSIRRAGLAPRHTWQSSGGGGGSPSTPPGWPRPGPPAAHGREVPVLPTGRLGRRGGSRKVRSPAYRCRQPPTDDIRHGFVYERVQHITLKSIANNPDIKEGMTREEIDEAIKRHADFELLYDKPYEDKPRCG
jgi:hypothetical protein